MMRTPPTALANKTSSRNTITTGISLFAGLLLVAGCGGQTDQAAQDAADAGTNAPTSTSNASGMDLPERTASAKNLKLDNPCSIITQQQAKSLGANQPPKEDTSAGSTGCYYAKGESGARSGWGAFVAADFKRTISEAIKTHPGGNKKSIAGYPSYSAKMSSIGCFVVANVSENGFLLVNGQVRPSPNKPDPCPLFTKFAKTAIGNLPNA